MRGIHRATTGAVAVVLALTIVPAAARGAADPTERGHFKVENIRYDAGVTTVRDPNGVTFAERLQGSLHIPRGRGPFPLLILLHGRHGTCELVERFESFGFPCPDAPPVIRDVPSYLGYEYLAAHLASHGFVVDSISANGINSYDIALLLSDNGMRMRAEIVARQLDLLSEWNKTASEDIGDALLDKIDFDRIGLMGHSRGGEGVTKFVSYNRERTDGPRYEGLQAVFALAPTDFYEQEATGVHFGTLLPLCDGDVYSLHGAWMYDRARFLSPRRFARVQFTVNGANHNFFNTVWTFDDGPSGGDDTGNNPACDPQRQGTTRLTAKEQREVGLALMSAFFLTYVGGDQGYEQFITGEAPLPPRACPDVDPPREERLSCDEFVGISYLGAATNYEMIVAPGADDSYSRRGALSVTECTSTTSGRGCPTIPTRSIATQLTVEWEGRGTLSVPVDQEVTRFDALTFRGGMNFKSPLNRDLREQDFEVALIDSAGREAVVHAAHFGDSFLRPAGGEHQQLTLNGTRIPLQAFGTVDLTRLARVEFRFGAVTRTGSIQLLEIGFQDDSR
ncbi:MAG TPA: hypothetical protein VG408_10500 [Actinomycetota bacterium]|nr:hypothetical protein [Actinomycetota bacterium]